MEFIMDTVKECIRGQQAIDRNVLLDRLKKLLENYTEGPLEDQGIYSAIEVVEKYFSEQLDEKNVTYELVDKDSKSKLTVCIDANGNRTAVGTRDAT